MHFIEQANSVIWKAEARVASEDGNEESFWKRAAAVDEVAGEIPEETIDGVEV